MQVYDFTKPELDMFRDIEEFIETLYNNTELQDERMTIQSMLSRLSQAL